MSVCQWFTFGVPCREEATRISGDGETLLCERHSRFQWTAALDSEVLEEALDLRHGGNARLISEKDIRKLERERGHRL